MTKKERNFQRYQRTSWIHPAAYPLDQPVDTTLYRPVAAWVGRLVLPPRGERDAEGGCNLELHHALPAYAQWVGQTVRLRYSPNRLTQARTWAVTRHVIFNKRAEKMADDGLVLSERINRWRLVTPLESLAAGHPEDDIIVRLVDPVLVAETADGMEIQAELDNVRQAWSNAAHNSAGAALSLGAYGLWQFYLLAGLSAEGVQAFLLAATALHGSPADKLAESSTQPQALILSKLWALSAYLLGTHGNYDEAIEAAQRAIGLANVGQPNVASQMAAALGRLAWGRALYHKSQFSESQTHNEQVLQAALAARCDSPSDETWPEIEVQVRLFLSVIARTQGDYQLAKSHLADCLRLCQQLGKVRGEVHAQLNLGLTAWLSHELESARQAYEQVLPLTIALHYRWGEGVACHELSRVMRDLGEYSLSLMLCQQALPIFVEINERLKQVYVLTDLIELYSCLGQFERATGYQAQLLTMLQHFKAPDAERVTLVASAVLAHYQDDNEQAFVYAHQLCQLVQPTNSRLYQAEALTLIGHAQAGLHRQTDAAESYTQALTLYQALGALAQAAEAQSGLADIALGQGDLAQATQLTEAVLTTLEHVSNAGLYEPFSIFLTCYRVLATTHDPRGHLVLQRAYTLLQSYAAHIDDEDLRHSFLHNVSVHRQLVLAYSRAPKPG